jgi:hypothetical protein
MHWWASTTTLVKSVRKNFFQERLSQDIPFKPLYLSYTKYDKILHKCKYSTSFWFFYNLVPGTGSVLIGLDASFNKFDSLFYINKKVPVFTYIQYSCTLPVVYHINLNHTITGTVLVPVLKVFANSKNKDCRNNAFFAQL